MEGESLMKHRSDEEKRQIVSRIFEHNKTVDVTAACGMEGIHMAQYYAWRQKLGFSKPLEEMVTVITAKEEVPKIEPKTEPKIEPTMVLAPSVPDLLNILGLKAKNCILIVEMEDGTLHPMIKGDEQKYSFLQAILGLKAIGMFKRQHPNGDLLIPKEV